MTRPDDSPDAPASTARPEAALTARDRAKAVRRAALLSAAARLFAERGFDGVTLEDIGAAAGVSGPAVYRHVSGKGALLGAILVDVSERLLTGGRGVADAATPGDVLAALVDFHVAFALAEADVIRVQDRELDRLSPDDRSRVRTLQNAYVDVWSDALRADRPAVDPAVDTAAERRVRALACFGLINSTPHSVRGLRGARAARVHGILSAMALAALRA